MHSGQIVLSLISCLKQCLNLNRIDREIPRDLRDGEAQMHEVPEGRAIDWPADPLCECLPQQAIHLVSIC